MGERRSSARVSSPGSCQVEKGNRNAVPPTVTSSTTAPVETALQCQAPGLLSPADRSVWKPRPCRPCSAAMPQAWGSGRRLMPFQPQCEESAKRGGAPPMSPWGRVPVCCPRSSRTSCFSPLGRESAPWIGLPPWDGIPPLERIPGETHLALRWVEIAGCGRRGKSTLHAAIPSWALRGEKPRSSRRIARADRDHAPRFLGSGNAGKARKRIQYPAPGGHWQGFRRQPDLIVDSVVTPVCLDFAGPRRA